MPPTSPLPLRRLLRLALPIVAVNLGQMAMSVVDTLMVGRVSAEAIAAVALGTLFFFAAAIAGEGILLALDPVVSQAVGARDARAQALGVQRGLILAGALTLPTAVLLLVSPWVMGLLRQPEAVVHLAADYVRIMAPGVLPFYLYVGLRQTLQAMGRVRPIFWTMLAANLANVALNWILIFGNLGFPALGVAGSAWATVASRWLMVGLLAAMAWPLLQPLLRPWLPDSRAIAPMRAMIRLGLPIGGQRMLEFMAFGGTALAMGWLGAAEMAGHQIALNMAAVAYMVPLGIGGAGAVLVGQAVGAGDERGARRFARLAMILGGGVMLGGAVVFVGIPSVLARFYTTDAAARDVAVLLLPLAGVFGVFDGLQAVGLGVLRGLADVRIPMLINLVGYWVLGLPAGLILAFPLGLGARGLWWGLVIGLASVAVLLLWRIRRRFSAPLRRLKGGVAK